MELIGLAIVAGVLALLVLAVTRQSDQLRKLRIQTMLDLAGLTVKIDALTTAVNALLALPTNPAPVDLQSAGDAVDALTASVEAKLTTPTV